MNEKIVEYVHWGCDNSYSNYYIIILWSDRTWERFNVGRRSYYNGGKTVKQYFNTGKAVRCKMTRSEFIEYFKEKMKSQKIES